MYQTEIVIPLKSKINLSYKNFFLIEASYLPYNPRILNKQRRNAFIYSSQFNTALALQVKGASIYSPYRLRPIIGVKLPLNATFSPFIFMHNPHAEPIQVTPRCLQFHPISSNSLCRSWRCTAAAETSTWSCPPASSRAPRTCGKSPPCRRRP